MNDSRVKNSDHIQYNIKHIYIALMPPSVVKLCNSKKVLLYNLIAS